MTRVTSAASRRAQAAVAWLALAGWRTASAAPAYTIVDLGSLGHVGGEGVVAAVNASGQVVGHVELPNEHVDAFRTAANSPIHLATDKLGSLGGVGNYAWAINASGQVAGSSYLAGNGFLHAFRTAAGGMIGAAGTDLGTLGGMSSEAYGINSAGRVAGSSSVVDDPIAPVVHAFRTTAAGRVSDAGTDLGTLGGTISYGYGINDAGQVVGESLTEGSNSFGAQHAFRTTANGKASDAGADLGTLGGFKSAAYAINAAGQAVGTASIVGSDTYFGPSHAFRTTATGKVGDPGADLGTLGGASSGAYAINGAGQVVGSAGTDVEGSYHAFLVDVTGPMRDLNRLIRPNGGWELIEGDGINDSGQIAGAGLIGGEEHAYLLTPARAGDATGNTVVDFDDLVILAQNYDVSDGLQTWWTGDFTGDGNVDFQDLVRLGQNYNTGAGGVSATTSPAFAADFAAALASVPEPGMMAAWGLGGVAWMRRRGRSPSYSRAGRGQDERGGRQQDANDEQGRHDRDEVRGASACGGGGGGPAREFR